ncbi:2-alkenal reductase (NADP(+)-dependent)-like isoform X1 [Pistacia vera]|uniref:2-alkenal reductase (NADP(+)-dependent)-like isoform X1 n=1 Tax=Pistacia vera TaxID=55513 RepID=UPI0012634356|nr:2-alkenal reductase (NADP(+)-dependent)-like isoform X1 [Pistacia vera]
MKVTMEVNNRYITIKTHIEGAPKESDFELKNAALALSIEAGSNDVIVKTLYVSIDPYQINRMKSYSSSRKATVAAAPINHGEAIDGYGVAKVVVSGNPEFQKDELVVGFVGWGEYKLVKGGDRLRKLDPMGFPLSNHAGIFGYGGLTAYTGFLEICKPRKGEKVFVSGASGSVGNLVGQFAKLFGCYVVGSVGNNKKVALLKEKLGFDDAFNYKEEPDLKATLRRYFPDGIDVYFDNVGGDMLEAAVANMNLFGRVAACGAISEYTNASKRASPNMLDDVYKRIKIQGFLVSDHINLYADFVSTIGDHLRNGKIQPLEDISNGVESIPSAFIGLFQGDNIGKKIVCVAQD